jgi:protein SCO1
MSSPSPEGTLVGAAIAAVLIALAPWAIRTHAAKPHPGTTPRGGVVSPAEPQSPDAGADFPNVLVQTHEGKRVRFYDDLIKGKAALINFMFTSCTSQCPLATTNLLKVGEALGERLGRDIVMVSVTVDPATDTPAVLKRYSSRHGTKPGWYFVTGRQKDVDLIRRRLGVLDDGTDKSQHTGMLVFGNDSTGQWAATPVMAEPKTIARSVLRLRPR